MQPRRPYGVRRLAPRGGASASRHRIVMVSTLALLVSVGLYNRPPRGLDGGPFAVVTNGNDRHDEARVRLAFKPPPRRGDDASRDGAAFAAATARASVDPLSSVSTAAAAAAVRTRSGMAEVFAVNSRREEEEEVDLRAAVRGCSPDGADNPQPNNADASDVKTTTTSATSTATAATKRVASSVITGGCIADGRVYSRAPVGSGGPWTAWRARWECSGPAGTSARRCACCTGSSEAQGCDTSHDK